MENRTAERKLPVELMYLALLSQKDMDWYEIAQEIRQRTDNRLSVIWPTVYFPMERLAAEGYISTREEEFGEAKKKWPWSKPKKLTRTFYHIEPSAEEYRQKLYAEYKDMTQAVDDFLASLT